MTVSSQLDLQLQPGGYSNAQAYASVELSAKGNLIAKGKGTAITINESGKYQAKLQQRLSAFGIGH
jgi:hypothetical protein